MKTNKLTLLFLIEVSLFLQLFFTAFLRAEDAAEFWAEISGEAVNIRSGPNINFESLGKLSKNEHIKVVGKSYQWCKIELPEGLYGFISQEYVKLFDKNKGIVTANRVNVRARADLNSMVLGQVNKQEILEIADKLKGWYRINLPSGFYGWVHSRFLRKIKFKKEFLDIKKEEKVKTLAKTDKLNTQEKPKEIKRAVEKKEDLPVASGIVQDSGKVFNRPGTHKLVKDGKVIYYLKGDKRYIGRFVRYNVNVWGKVDSTTYPLPVIFVKKITLKQ